MISLDSFISGGSGALDNCTAAAASSSSLRGYCILFDGLSLIPTWHYFLGFMIACIVFIYNFLESHFIEDLLSGFRGSPAKVTCNPDSEIYSCVASECHIIHGRYRFELICWKFSKRLVLPGEDESFICILTILIS